MEEDFVLIDKDLSCRDPEDLIPCPTVGETLSAKSDKPASVSVGEPATGIVGAPTGSGPPKSDVDCIDAEDSEADLGEASESEESCYEQLDNEDFVWDADASDQDSPPVAGQSAAPPPAVAAVHKPGFNSAFVLGLVVLLVASAKIVVQILAGPSAGIAEIAGAPIAPHDEGQDLEERPSFGHFELSTSELQHLRHVSKNLVYSHDDPQPRHPQPQLWRSQEQPKGQRRRAAQSTTTASPPMLQASKLHEQIVEHQAPPAEPQTAPAPGILPVLQSGPSKAQLPVKSTHWLQLAAPLQHQGRTDPLAAGLQQLLPWRASPAGSVGMRNSCQADHAGTAVTLWELLADSETLFLQPAAKQSSALALLPSTALALSGVC